MYLVLCDFICFKGEFRCSLNLSLRRDEVQRHWNYYAYNRSRWKAKDWRCFFFSLPLCEPLRGSTGSSLTCAAALDLLLCCWGRTLGYCRCWPRPSTPKEDKKEVPCDPLQKDLSTYAKWVDTKAHHSRMIVPAWKRVHTLALQAVGIFT